MNTSVNVPPFELYALIMLIEQCCILESKASAKDIVGAEFRWTRVKFNAFRLTWHTQYLVKLGVQTIEVVYTQVDSLDRVASKMVSVDKGEVIIGRLFPNSRYSMEVLALGDGTVVLTHDTLLRTWPTGEFIADCIHCVYLYACVEFSIAVLK